MSQPTRSEHMAWCKKRALEYLPNDPQQAVTSMLSDLRKHPETERVITGPTGSVMFALAMQSMDSHHQARSFIEGFN